MRKKVMERKKGFSITINNELLKMLDEETSNRSRLIECLLFRYFNESGKDVSKIKL